MRQWPLHLDVQNGPLLLLTGAILSLNIVLMRSPSERLIPFLVVDGPKMRVFPEEESNVHVREQDAQ
jgi:hypothetical protein